VPATILHDNGRHRVFADRRWLVPNLGPVFCRLLEREVLGRQGSSRGRVRKPHDLDVVLCSTRPARQYTETILDALGIDGYVVLGRHLPEWKHVFKIQLVLEHIERHPQPALLLHLDATDVLVVGELQSAVAAFLGEGSCDLLFGAEKGSAPGSRSTGGITSAERLFIERIEEFERSTYQRPFRHLNAGCFIGRKEAVRELFSEALAVRQSWPLTTVLRNGNRLADDDQLILRELHRTHHPRVRIDHLNAVFQNLFAIRRSELAVERRIARGPGFVAEYLRHLAFIVRSRARRGAQARP